MILGTVLKGHGVRKVVLAGWGVYVKPEWKTESEEQKLQ